MRRRRSGQGPLTLWAGPRGVGRPGGGEHLAGAPSRPRGSVSEADASEGRARATKRGRTQGLRGFTS